MKKKKWVPIGKLDNAIRRGSPFIAFSFSSTPPGDRVFGDPRSPLLSARQALLSYMWITRVTSLYLHTRVHLQTMSSSSSCAVAALWQFIEFSSWDSTAFSCLGLDVVATDGAGWLGCRGIMPRSLGFCAKAPPHTFILSCRQSRRVALSCSLKKRLLRSIVMNS